MSEVDRFTEKYPWLKEIPGNIRDLLDLSEFYEPDMCLLDKAKDIGAEYGVNVMIYNASSGGLPMSGKRHLCTTIKSAIIPDSAVQKLLGLESAFAKDNIRVVCYQNPVKLREIA